MLADTLSRAANGDKSAQIEMAEIAVGAANKGACDPLISLVEACMFARLAALQGGNIDRARLVSALSLLGDELVSQGKMKQADTMHGEAIAHIDVLADNGEELAESNMLFLAQESTPAQLAMAKYFRKMWGNENATR